MSEKRKLRKKKNNTFKFNTETLTAELSRLTKLFLPNFDVPEIRLEVRGRVYAVAAHTYYKQNRIVMFKAYHDKFPGDYKTTLLHEVGHIIADHGHGENFKRYFNTLKKRQEEVEEKVIPSSYCDFLFSKISRHFTRKYYCPACRSVKVYRKRMSVSCSKCGIPMLEDSFFKGVEAVLSLDYKEEVDFSTLDVGLFTPDCVLK